MNKGLELIYTFQTRRIEAELALHWQRIQIATVGLVGVITAVGYLLLQHDCASHLRLGITVINEKSLSIDHLTVVAFALMWVISWYLVVLTISGAYWIRVNEQKLGAIEEVLFGTTIYDGFIKKDTRALSLTMFTKVLFTSVGSLALWLLGIGVWYSFEKRGTFVCSLLALELDAYSVLVALIPVVLWFCFSCKRQSDAVFGGFWSHKQNHDLIRRRKSGSADADNYMIDELRRIQDTHCCKGGERQDRHDAPAQSSSLY
jgi:hypothetical protein